MDFNSQDSQEIMKNFKSIIGSRLEKLDNEKGADGELYAYSIAVANQKKKKAKETPQDITMENNRLREMVIDALTEKKKSFPDLTGDGKVTKADILKARGVELDEAMISPDNRVDYLENALGHIWNMGRGNNNIDLKSMAQSLVNDMFDESLNEDLDLGHTDDEPHMIKAELYQIGTYALELYKMLNKFEGPQEVDLPAWWQSKITTAKNMVSSAKHYLDFELKEPKLDAIISAQDKEEAIDEMSKKQIKKRGEIFDALVDKGMPKKKAGPIATSTAMKEAKAKIKEAILAKLKNK